MSPKNILFSWAGHADLVAMSQDLPNNRREKLLKEVYPRDKDNRVSPIKVLTTEVLFDEIHLFSNSSDWINKEYCNWLQNDKVAIHRLKLSSPIDHEEVFKVFDSNLANLLSKNPQKSFKLSFFLSPGTPTMAAIWVLLGKSKYPATFWQTYKNRAKESTIPFDLTVDFIPEVLQKSDSIFHRAIDSKFSDSNKIVGKSPSILRALDVSRKVAFRDVSVLLTGESGTGKELFARYIHKNSSKCGGPFIPVNCAAFPEDLLESELFGHNKGSFTGASKDHPGAFALADGGVLFLDEVGECSPSMQAKLLRALQPPPGEVPSCREIKPLGARNSVRYNVRVIAATNRNLIQLVHKSMYRDDLYWRLAQITIKIPPLRERVEDIPILAEYLLQVINLQFSRHDPGYRRKNISDNAKFSMQEHYWPGNVRELSNILMQASIMVGGKKIRRADIQEMLHEHAGIYADCEAQASFGVRSFSLAEHLDTIKTDYFMQALTQAGGNLEKAAILLGYKHANTMKAQMKKLKFDWNIWIAENIYHDME